MVAQEPGGEHPETHLGEEKRGTEGCQGIPPQSRYRSPAPVAETRPDSEEGLRSQRGSEAPENVRHRRNRPRQR